MKRISAHVLIDLIQCPAGSMAVQLQARYLFPLYEPGLTQVSSHALWELEGQSLRPL